MPKKKNLPFEQKTVERSNELIDAQSSTTLLEEQIIAIAQSRIQEQQDRLGVTLYAELYPGELKRIVSDPAHISRDLKKLSISLLQHIYVVDDEDDPDGFQAYNLVNNCDYKNGVFKMEFNRQVKKHLFNLESNYTSLSLSVMSEFHSIYSLRLYEILKKDLYKIDKFSDGDSYVVEYDIFRLRFMIGIANNDNEQVAIARKKMGANIDYEALYNVLPPRERKYERFDRFKADVLTPAYNEMKEKADLRFEYEPKCKKGRKITSLVFTIYKNTPNNVATLIEKKNVLDENNPNSQSSNDIEIIPRVFYSDFYKKYIGHNDLIAEDIDILMQDSNYDPGIIEQAIMAADSKPFLKNYIGWIRSYIRAGGFNDSPSAYGSTKRAKKGEELLQKIQNANVEDRMDSLSRAWERSKASSERFESFKQAIEMNGISFEEFEEAYTPDEKIAIFMDYKQGKGIKFKASIY